MLGGFAGLNRWRDTNYNFGDQSLEDYLNPARHFTFPLNVARARTLSGFAQKAHSKSDNEFKLMLNVQHFHPDEIDVKTVGDFIVVHGKHEEQADQHGLVAREFTRRYKIPEDVESKQISSFLSSDGILTIQAPRKTAPLPKNERIVPIILQQGAVAEEARRIEKQQQSDDEK